MRFRIQIFDALNKLDKKIFFPFLSQELKKVNTIAFFAEFKYVFSTFLIMQDF